MAVIHTYLTCELQKLLKVQYLDGNLFSQDNQANEFHVIVLDNGEPAEISGTVTADVIRSDGGTVAVTGGTIEGNVASITFNAAVYAIPGVVSIVVKLTTSGVVTTIAAAVTNVYQSSTSVTVDPGTIIPSIQTLISSIETAVASIPADYSSLWTSLAPAFSSSASYVAGQYCTYNGAVYRFNTSHTGSWAAGDVTAVNIGGELTALKSALNEKCSPYINLFNPAFLLQANDWNQNGTEYYGTAYNLSEKYKNALTAYPINTFLPSTVYKIEFDARTDGNAGSTGNGLRIVIEYTDGTTDKVAALNSYNEYTHISFLTNSGKSINCIYFGYGTNGYNVWHIKNIMIAKNGTEYNYLPYLIPADYYSRDKIEEIEEFNELTDEKIEMLNDRTIGPQAVLVTPEGFSWQNHPLVGKVRTDYKGNYAFDFDVNSYDVSGQGVAYYVDSTNGNDNNSGLSADSPLKKMATAYNKQDCSCIMLFDGIYNNGANLNAITIEKNIAIKAIPGAKPIIATHSGSTFTLYDGNTYSASRGSCVRIVDLSNKNPYGDPLEYTKLGTVSGVVSTAGSWALIEGVLYVHCIDDREPDQYLLLLVASNNLYCEGNPTVYLEGLTVISGYSPLKVSNTQSLTNPKVYAKNCDFLYSESTSNDVVMLQGTELSVFQNCKALYGMKDGFNYHAKNGTIPKAIEINCIGAMCGNAEDSNDQGSTIHDGGLAIRINCTYFRNIGSNVADEASESWNVGCVAYEPLAPNSGQRGNYYALSNTKMWLDSCRGFGKPHYNVLSATDNTTEVYFRNNTFENADKTVPIYGTTPIYY